MRTEAAVRGELIAARQALHATAGTLTENEARARCSAITALLHELSDLLTDGADVCPDCGQRPHGNHKQEARFVLNPETQIETQVAPDLFVVRCLECSPRRYLENEVLSPDGLTKRVTTTIIFPSSKGETVTEAVHNWNAGHWIETREIATVKIEAAVAAT